ncbi:MAG: hypothetical protein R2873_30275 [Caldilineaceae bacterium]
MKVLFIGGTGIISSACSRLALQRGIDLYLLNRGQSHRAVPEGRRCSPATSVTRFGAGGAGRSHLRCRGQLDRAYAGAGAGRHRSLPRPHRTVRLY